MVSVTTTEATKRWQLNYLGLGNMGISTHIKCLYSGFVLVLHHNLISYGLVPNTFHYLHSAIGSAIGGTCELTSQLSGADTNGDASWSNECSATWREAEGCLFAHITHIATEMVLCWQIIPLKLAPTPLWSILFCLLRM